MDRRLLSVAVFLALGAAQGVAPADVPAQMQRERAK
jgi:hypothetical protein